jgi:hypothetical protein
MRRAPRHRQRPLAGRGPNPVRFAVPAIVGGCPGRSGVSLVPRVHAHRCDRDRCAMLVSTQDGHRAVLVAGLPIAHDAVGDAMAGGPSRRRRHAAGRTGADPTLSGSVAPAGPRYAKRAKWAPSRCASQGSGCASAMRSRPEIRTVQPAGMSGGLDSGNPMPLFPDPRRRFCLSARAVTRFGTRTS